MDRELVELMVPSATMARLDSAQARLSGLRIRLGVLTDCHQVHPVVARSRLCLALGALAEYADHPSRWMLVGWALTSSHLTSSPAALRQTVLDCLQLMPASPLHPGASQTAFFHGLKRGDIGLLWTIRRQLEAHTPLDAETEREFIATLMHTESGVVLRQQLNTLLEAHVRARRAGIMTLELGHQVIASSCVMGHPPCTAVWFYLCLVLESERGEAGLALQAEELLQVNLALHGLEEWGEAMNQVMACLQV